MEIEKDKEDWLEQAVENARKKELEKLKGSKPDLAVVNKQEQIAQSMTPKFTLVKVRDVNKAEFAQIITDNVRLLLEQKYLERWEQAFLFALAPSIERHTNALVKHEIAGGQRRSTGKFLTVSEIANIAGIVRQTASEMVSNLLRKGIMYEVTDIEQIKMYGRVVSERIIFLNPEIIFAGDKNRINATLCRIVTGADRIEKTGIHLPWKVWLKEGAEHGRLYKRNTYLHLKSGNDVND